MSFKRKKVVEGASDARLHEVLEKAWLLPDALLDDLNITTSEDLDRVLRVHATSPLLNRTPEDIANPHVHLLRIMRDPEYFPFTCKEIFNITILPLQHAILKELWHKPFPMLIGSRGMGKSFILALYMMLRATLCQGVKICIVGAAFRQAKVVFEYCEQIWANAPVLRDLCGTTKGRNNRDHGPRRDIDRCELIIGDSIIIALPLGDGKKIRGQRANYIIADEFASIPPEIYENVVAGFAAVSADPMGNVMEAARRRMLKRLGLWTPEMDVAAEMRSGGNQAILSGTAYYDFNHFASYWKRYKAIINSRGDQKKLAELNKDSSDEVDKTLNHRDYCVIRVPVDLLPEGFMDQRHVARSKATVHSGIYKMEFGACFTLDSDGFFKRSLIETCVVGRPQSPIHMPSCGLVNFTTDLRGDPQVRHVFGVDPASEKDNFTIVVVALHGEHRRVVHCWATNRKAHQARVKAGVCRDEDYYGFAARKIRDLMKVFPCVHIAMDKQGGGVAVYEALHDSARLQEGELPIWEVKDPDPKKHKDSDDKPGLHILEFISFSDGDWVRDANHGMRKDMEDKVLLFPYMDPAKLGLAIEEDKALNRLYDTLEDATMEIEAMKDEVATIVHTQTGVAGRDHWDVPTTTQANNKKGRLRKDRYTSLLIANMAGRQLMGRPPEQPYNPVGGFASKLGKHKRDGAMYVAPDWFLSGGTGTINYGAAVNRNKGPAGV